MSWIPCLGQMTFVLLATYSGALGGAERALLDFAAALEGEICLACPEGPLFDAARSAALRVLPLPARALDLRTSPRDRPLAAQRLAAHANELRRLVRDLDPDLVVACGMRSAIALSVSRNVRAPTMFLHNDMLPGAWIARGVRAVAAHAELVIVPSRAVGSELGAGIRPIVINPGVDVDRFEAVAPPAGAPEVMVLGAIAEWKRTDLALEACSLARRERPDLRVRIVGGPLDARGAAFLARLRERASQPDLAGAVEFSGRVEDPASLLCRCSCLLHCAEREPFGIAVVEALASGRPAVVPASGGPAEIVDRSCGVLYPPGDAVAASRALIELLSDPSRSRRMGASGRDVARDRFNVVDARRKFADAAGSLMRKRARLRPRASLALRPRGSLALVTVTHNSAHEVEALLRSAKRHIPEARVVVVDSASRDDTVSTAKRLGARVIALSDNVGFGRAANLAIAEVEEPITAIVNPDVELLDDSLRALAAEAARLDRPERLLAPLVLSSDGSRQDSVHPRPLSAADLVSAVLPPAVLPSPAASAIAPWHSSKPRAVGWAVGCAVLARTHTLRRLGPFDERIFLYGEDLDLGLAAGDEGVQTWFWPSARVLHHGAHSTSVAFGGEPFDRLAKARHDVIARRLGRRRARVDDAAQAITFTSRIAYKRALRRDTSREQRQLAALNRTRER